MVAHIVLRGVVSALTIVATVAQPPAARADAAEVEALIAKGNELRRAGTPGPALPYFQKAYELARTPRTSGQLGLAELAAGYPVEAAEHLAAALETPDDPSIVKYRKMLADALTLARSQIGELVVEGSPAGAEIVVDGRAVGVLPLPSAIRLAARTAEIVIRAPGCKQQREVVPIVGGQRHALTVNLERIEKPSEAPPTVTRATVSPNVPVTRPVAAPVVVDQRRGSDGGSSGSTSRLRIAAWVTGGGAIVAAGAGLALNLAARSNRDDFNGSCVNMNGIHMVPGQPLMQGDCEARSDAWQSDRRWSIVGYLSGAALAVTSGILFWISRPTSLTGYARAQVTCEPTLTGLSCQGFF